MHKKKATSAKRVKAAKADTVSAAAVGTKDASPYIRIRDDILSLVIAPDADLEESVLAAVYGVSRTPIREALIRLASDGLVEFRPKRGARVIPIVLPNLPRYLETLDLIKRALARISATRSLPRDSERITQAIAEFAVHGKVIDTRDYATVLAAANAEAQAFRAIAEGAHNIYMLEVFEKLQLQGQRMLRLAFAYQPLGTENPVKYATARLTVFKRLKKAIDHTDGAAAELAMKELHQMMTHRLQAYLIENLAEDVSISDNTTPTV